MQDLGRRQRVQLEVRVARLHAAEQILVPGDRQVGVVAALQQQLVAAERPGLVDLAEDLLEAEDVAFGMADGAVERAEVAAGDADVGVVDVAVDDVGDDAVGMLAPPDRVGHPSEPQRRGVAVEVQRLVTRQPAAGHDPGAENVETRCHA